MHPGGKTGFDHPPPKKYSWIKIQGVLFFMEIIPVLDLMNHMVVHGVQGQRQHYKPVESILTKSSDPLDIARALGRETNCRSLYLADLDAIQGRADNMDLIKELTSSMDIDFWLDAGICTPEAVVSIANAGVKGIILGSESLESMAALELICKAGHGQSIIFSLDMVEGRVISPAGELGGKTPAQALDLLYQMGLRRFILLTLDAVGTAKGPDISLLQSAVKPFTDAFFIAGGGVKKAAHLKALSKIGIHGVLVATSLHRGWITKEDLMPFARQG